MYSEKSPSHPNAICLVPPCFLPFLLFLNIFLGFLFVNASTYTCLPTHTFVFLPFLTQMIENYICDFVHTHKFFFHLICLGGFFILNFLFIYILFLAVLGLRFCVRAFSSCGKRGPLFIAVRGPLTVAASLVAEHKLQTRRLSSCGSRA